MARLTDPIDILLTHNHWANINLLTTAKTLSPEQFHKRFEIGPGSVHDTLSHVLGAMHRWTRALAQQDMAAGDRPEATQRTPDELIILAHALNDALVAIARAHPSHEPVTVLRAGKTHTFIRAAILTHVTTHGVHHRAQCLNMFRQLGVTPTPQSAVVEWMLTSQAQ